MPKILRLAKLAKQINGKNLLDNGNFDIWQRGLSFDQPGFTADRWFVSMYTNETDARENTIVAKKVLSGGDIDNNSYAIRLENSVSGEYYYLSQVVPTDNVLPHQGETATISYYARTPDNSFSGLLYSAFYYTPYVDEAIKEKTLISDSAITGSISSGWTQFTQTFTIPSNAKSLIFEIQPYDLNLPNNCQLDITQAKFEIGSQASPLIPLDYNEELSICEQFYQKISHASPLPNNNPNISLTIPTKQRLKNTRLSKIKNFRNQSRNVLDQQLSILNNNNILLNARTANAAGNLDLSELVIESEIYPVDKPLSPSNITSITGVVTSGLVIQWSGSYDNGSPINYYVINYGLSENNLDESILVDISGSHPSGSPTSGTITDLLENVQHYFQITAYNGFGSASTNIMSHFFDQYPDPSAVINLSARHVNSSTQLSWSSYQGSPIPELYVIDRDVTASFNSEYLTTKRVPNRTSGPIARHINAYSFSNYDNSQSGNYYFRVSTVLNNTTGVSDTISINRTTPSKIINVITTVNTDPNSIDVSWTVPSSDNGSAITGYIIQYNTNSGLIDQGSTTFVTTNNTLLPGLSAGIETFLRVAAINEFGTGIWSDITSETPNRTPGTPSSPRNLVASWPDTAWWPTSTDNSLWQTSRNLSDYIRYTPYKTDNNKNYDSNGSVSWNWPVSIAHIDWDSPVDNGGQSISYYNIVADTSSTYNSSNLKNYNTLFFRQTSALLINELITTSTGTWYIKCAAVNPSGTGSYATTTLFSDVPKLIYSTPGSSSFSVYSTKIIDSQDGKFNYAKAYFVNSCGLPLLSGYALTGINNSNPTTRNSYTALYPDIRPDSNNNFFQIYISGIPAGNNFSLRPVWFNVAGSGAMSRPATGDMDQTPYSPADDFRALTYRLGNTTINTRPTIRLSSAQRWTSSVGFGTFSGVFYSGNPSTGTIINNTYDHKNFFTTTIVPNNTTLLTLPTPTLNTLPVEFWLKGNVILTTNNGTQYISQDQNIQIWNNRFRPPSIGFIHTHSYSDTSKLYFHHYNYSTASLANRGGADISQMSYQVYIDGLPEYAQNLNLNSSYTLVDKALLSGPFRRYGSQRLVVKISNPHSTNSTTLRRVSFGYLEGYFIPKIHYAYREPLFGIGPVTALSVVSPYTRLVGTGSLPIAYRLNMPVAVSSGIGNNVATALVSGRSSFIVPSIVATDSANNRTILFNFSSTAYRSISYIDYLNRSDVTLSLVDNTTSNAVSLPVRISRQGVGGTTTQPVFYSALYCNNLLLGWLISREFN